MFALDNGLHTSATCSFSTTGIYIIFLIEVLQLVTQLGGYC